jgi:hypothetical protein
MSGYGSSGVRGRGIVAGRIPLFSPIRAFAAFSLKTITTTLLLFCAGMCAWKARLRQGFHGTSGMLPSVTSFSATKEDVRKSPSSKKAMKHGAGRQHILYISMFRWEEECRNNSYIGAKALRSILVDSRLAVQWSACFVYPG